MAALMHNWRMTFCLHAENKANSVLLLPKSVVFMNINYAHMQKLTYLQLALVFEYHILHICGRIKVQVTPL